MLPLLTAGTVKPIVESTYKLEDAAEALRHLIEDRPFGRVVLAGSSVSLNESFLPRIVVRC
jgi:NADPH:quinone reductase